MISHEHRAVFVHVPKTAGQSVETAFLDALGVHWRDRAPLLLMKNDNPQVGPPRLAHLTAPEYVRHHYISQRLFDEYFTFGFVRDPWARTFSMYKYLGVADEQTFSQFVLRTLRERLWKRRHWWVRPQADYLYDDSDHLLVDFLGRFESLEDDFAVVAERVGLANRELPRVNVSAIVERPDGTIAASAGAPAELSRPQPGHRYGDQVDDRAHAVVCALYARDIELLEYSFEKPPETLTPHTCGGL